MLSNLDYSSALIYKCCTKNRELLLSTVNFLRHVNFQDALAINSHKLYIFQMFIRQATGPDIAFFLGLCNYYSDNVSK